MERGYADCPDMTRLTKKLAKLYGADLTVDARPMGCNHNLCVSAVSYTHLDVYKRQSAIGSMTDIRWTLFFFRIIL